MIRRKRGKYEGERDSEIENKEHSPSPSPEKKLTSFLFFFFSLSLSLSFIASKKKTGWDGSSCVDVTCSTCMYYDPSYGEFGFVF